MVFWKRSVFDLDFTSLWSPATVPRTQIYSVWKGTHSQSVLIVAMRRAREQFHGLSIVVIRACTKTVNGHGAIMEFNNAICSLFLSSLLFFSLLSWCLLFFSSLPSRLFQFLLLATMRRSIVEQIYTRMPGQTRSLPRFVG